MVCPDARCASSGGDRDTVFTDDDRWGTITPPAVAFVAEQGQQLQHLARVAAPHADGPPSAVCRQILPRASRHLIRDCNHFDLVRKRARQLAEIIAGVVEREVDRSYASYHVRTLCLGADSSSSSRL